ncbi:MAG: hypothetical protein AUH13_06685 [Acidobacteria bacterium 13_2_20CM_58_27]|nr:MAG: hypothetical protein AUH13_06685 [Acidobacteria bacterium 13_2_20CM_58_27]
MSPAPGVFQYRACEPQKPHILDEVQPAPVKKICRQIGDGLRMSWGEGVLLEHGGLLGARELLRKRIHFLL